MSRRRGFDPEDAASALKTQGGFSVKVGSGRSPRRGRMVSVPGAEEIVPGHADSQQISEYVGRRGRELRRPGAYLGGWAEDGQTFLDVSRRHLDPREAIKAGQEGAQYGVYDIDKDRTINPFGAGIKYRGTLLENLSRNERRRVSTSNASLRVEEMRKGIASQPSGIHEKDAVDFTGDQKLPKSNMPKQMKLRGV